MESRTRAFRPMVVALGVLGAGCQPGEPASRTELDDLARLVPAWSADGTDLYGSFGQALGSAGDVNGDGLSDLVVGDPDWSDKGQVSTFRGGGGAFATTPDWTVSASDLHADLGASVAAAGDVDGDGYGDVVVGAPGRSSGKGTTYLYRGSSLGLRNAAAWTYQRAGADAANLGASVDGAGDVDGDGYDDVIVGAPNVAYNEGEAALFLGGAGGLPAAPSWTFHPGGQALFVGASVAGAGDVDGDGFDDVLIGAPAYSAWPDRGLALLFDGSPAGLRAAPSWTATGSYNLKFGEVVASAGDVNADGFDDLLIGGANVTVGGSGPTTAEARLFLGSAAGPSAAPDWTWTVDIDAWWTLSLAAAGDFDGDGYGDVLVGTPSWLDHGAHTRGKVWLFLGTPTGLGTDPAYWWTADPSGDLFGISVGSVGDTNGDGFDDVVIGDPAATADQWSDGVVELWPGHVISDAESDGFPDDLDDCPDVPDPSQADLDRDGVGDACDDPYLDLVGAPFTPGDSVELVATGLAAGETARFFGGPGTGGVGPCPAPGLCLMLGPAALPLGTAVADAAGRASMVSSVPASLVPGGTYALQVAVVRGVAGATSAQSTVELLGPADLDWDGDTLTDAQELAQHTDPGDPDTDHDGLADPVDVAPLFDPLNPDTDGDAVPDGVDSCPEGADQDDLDGDGVARACDNCPDDANTSQLDRDEDGIGEACEAMLGPVWHAASGAITAWAGDVDGDGHDDLVASVPWAGGGGRVDLYLGQSDGLSPTPAWTLSFAEAGAGFGASVSGAGDVNGDGYADLLVGAPGHDGGQVDEGGAWLYLGSATGPGSVPAWAAEPDLAGAGFGSSVSAAGDVNGDGYDDVVVGAPGVTNGHSHEGRASVFLGSAAGLSPSAAWEIEASQAGALLGSAVGAGDLDGDGYDDVVVGAPGYTQVEAGAGAVFVFRGSAGGPSPVASTLVRASAPRAGIGSRLSAAGDLDGDGHDDLVVSGAGQSGSTCGGATAAARVSVYLGSATGVGTTPAWTETWPATNTCPAVAVPVASAGDVQGDGLADLVIGRPHASKPEYREGEVLLYPGAVGGVGPLAWSWQSDRAQLTFGASVALADVDADGSSDLVVGSGEAQPRAHAFLFLGNP